MYLFKPIPSIVQPRIPFGQKYMRELGKNELSAIFIILMEYLLTTNNQRKIETFYIRDIQFNQNFGYRYQQFLKKTFNTKDQITFKIFLELQKVQDPSNVQSGEFLKAFYYEITNKQISIPSVIEYIFKNFNVFIVIVASQHLGSGKTQIPKDSYAIILQELDYQYSIIKEQQPPEQSGGCFLCNSKSQYFIQDGGKHRYCLECLQKKIGYGPTSKTFYTCLTCYLNIYKVDVRALEQKQKTDGNQENLKVTNSQLTQSQYQPPRQAAKLCSKCQSQVLEQQYYQNNCNHILCYKCVEAYQIKYSTCAIDNCTIKVDHDTLQQFYKSYKSQLQKNEQTSDQNRANQPNYTNQSNQSNQTNQASSIYQNRQMMQSQIPQSMQSQIKQPMNEEYHSCADCQRQYKIDMLFTNYCGHFYCGKCSNRYSSNIYQVYCKDLKCGQQIDVKQLKQFFIDQKIEQQKKTYDNCTICGLKLTLYEMFQNSCKHNICFDCINKAFNKQYDWLGKGRCPDIQCRLSINLEELEDFFVQKQQERLQEIDQQEIKKETYAMQIEEPQDQQNNDELKINDQRKDNKYNLNPRIEQIVQQQKNSSQILNDNRSVIQNGSQLKLKDASNCSMCGEDLTEFNKPFKMDCRKSIHVVGVCCYLRDFDKCLCCEKQSPYKTFQIKFQKASNQVMESQIMMESQIIQSAYNQNGYQAIDDNRQNAKLTLKHPKKTELKFIIFYMNNQEIKEGLFILLGQILNYCKQTRQSISQLLQAQQLRELDINLFCNFIGSLLPQSNTIIRQHLFKLIQQNYNSQILNATILEKVLENYQKMNQNQLQMRNPEQIYTIMSDKLANAKIQVEEIFAKYDTNKDNMMSKIEFQEMIKIIIKDIQPQELTQIIQFSFELDQSITLFKFMKLMRNNNTFQRINSQQPEKVNSPPIQNVMESNYYENPMNEQMLNTAQIKFDEYVIDDMNIPAMKEFAQKFQQLKQTNSKYTDPTFPPNKQSLGKRFNFEWKRAGEITNQFFVRENTNQRFGIGKWISCDDLMQGQLGDCYFLASISALGNRRPDLMFDIFVTRRINPYGIYCLKLCIDGGWKGIVVDDYVPVQYNQPAFTKGRNNEIWVMLIEKAWAKVFESYENIEAGYGKEVLRALTGAPTESLFTKDADFETELQKRVNNRCVMVCSTNKDVEKQDVGLVASHAYTILKIKKSQINQNLQLIKLRNPWGKKEWKGAWSDESPLWTQQLKQEFKVVSENNGIFYMDMASFRKNFSDVSVCHVKERYKYQSIYMESNKRNSQYYQLNIQTQGIYYITINQENKRFRKADDYSIARIIIFQDGKIINGIQKKQQETWCEVNLAPGMYGISAKVFWHSANKGQYNLSIYGPNNVQMFQIQKPFLSINNAFLNLARQSELKPYNLCPQILKSYQFKIEYGFGFLYLVNNSDKILETEITMTMKGLKLRKPYRGDKIQLVVEPKKEILILFTVSALGFIFQLQESYKII